MIRDADFAHALATDLALPAAQVVARTALTTTATMFCGLLKTKAKRARARLATAEARAALAICLAMLRAMPQVRLLGTRNGPTIRQHSTGTEVKTARGGFRRRR